MINVLKYYKQNIKQDEYYYRYYDKLIKEPEKIAEEFEVTEVDGLERFSFFDDEDIIEKFRFLCQPEMFFSSGDDSRLFYFICYYLYKQGYKIKEFPNILRRPPEDPYNFTYTEIRNRLVFQGKQRDDGIVPYSERRKLIASLSFERNTSLAIDDNIDLLFEKISTRNANFDKMENDEKLKEIANLIENLLYDGKKYKILDYKKIMFDFIDDDTIKNFRNKIQCFRHSSEKSLKERNSYSKEQKDFMIDYGITIIKVIYKLTNDN